MSITPNVIRVFSFTSSTSQRTLRFPCVPAICCVFASGMANNLVVILSSRHSPLVECSAISHRVFLRSLPVTLVHPVLPSSICLVLGANSPSLPYFSCLFIISNIIRVLLASSPFVFVSCPECHSSISSPLNFTPYTLRSHHLFCSAGSPK